MGPGPRSHKELDTMSDEHFHFSTFKSVLWYRLSKGEFSHLL